MLRWHGLWRLGAPSHSGGKAIAWRNRILTGWARDVAHVIGMHVQIEGPLPAAPFLLVTNHLSYLDIPMIASACGCAFVAKKEVARWPLLGRMTADLGAIFVDRENIGDVTRVSECIAAALGAGQSVALFPEGTSSMGARVAPFHPALLASVARLGIPVHYAALTYRTRAGEATGAPERMLVGRNGIHRTSARSF